MLTGLPIDSISERKKSKRNISERIYSFDSVSLYFIERNTLVRSLQISLKLGSLDRRLSTEIGGV